MNAGAIVAPNPRRASPLRGRFGTALLLVGGLVLLGLMGFTLILGDAGPRAVESKRAQTSGDSAPIEVAVFLSDPEDWDAFRAGARATGAPLLADDDRELTATTPGGRPLRFLRERVAGGPASYRTRARELARAVDPPDAVIGTDKSLTTRSLLEGLNEAGGRSLPVLLGGASADEVAVAKASGPTPVRLLNLYPGHVFRFCFSNAQSARRVVDRASLEGVPALTIAAVDTDDPYSADLAEGFHRAIAQRFGTPPRWEERPIPFEAGLTDRLDDAVIAWARGVRARAASLPQGTVWVVLPLLRGPALRLLEALVATADQGPGRLAVLAGDALHADLLRPLAGRCPFPVWSASRGALPREGGLSGQVQVPAEMVLALLKVADGPGLIEDRLRNLRLDAGDPGGLGRSIAFTPEGERDGPELGCVLELDPRRPGVWAVARDPRGNWLSPVAAAD